MSSSPTSSSSLAFQRLKTNFEEKIKREKERQLQKGLFFDSEPKELEQEEEEKHIQTFRDPSSEEDEDDEYDYLHFVKQQSRFRSRTCYLSRSLAHTHQYLVDQNSELTFENWNQKIKDVRTKLKSLSFELTGKRALPLLNGSGVDCWANSLLQLLTVSDTFCSQVADCLHHIQDPKVFLQGKFASSVLFVWKFQNILVRWFEECSCPSEDVSHIPRSYSEELRKLCFPGVVQQQDAAEALSLICTHLSLCGSTPSLRLSITQTNKQVPFSDKLLPLTEQKEKLLLEDPTHKPSQLNDQMQFTYNEDLWALTIPTKLFHYTNPIDSFFYQEELGGEHTARLFQTPRSNHFAYFTPLFAQCQVIDAPSGFFVVLNRFDAQNQKINQTCEIPQTITLEDGVHFEKDKVFHKSSLRSQLIYSLAGFVEHLGSSPYSGHYISYVKNREKGWTLCNDVSIASVSTEEALQHCHKAYLYWFTFETSR